MLKSPPLNSLTPAKVHVKALKQMGSGKLSTIMARRRKKQRVLLVGLDYSGPIPRGVTIETKGLCRPQIAPEQAAAPLYDYDVIIINPTSYSHFIFGLRGPHSESDKELWHLKRENDKHDFDTIFARWERQEEMKAALESGTRVVWVMAEERKIHFFGWRSLYQGYISHTVESLATAASFTAKESRKLTIGRPSHPLASYFKQLTRDGWALCGSFPEGQDYLVLASTPERKALGVEIEVEGARGWLVTPPPSMSALRILIKAAVKIKPQANQQQYHGIFLSHTHTDKPFVRRLKTALNERGVSDVWVDEAEIMVGDTLTQKIEEGLTKTRYFGVVLSPSSIKSRWVQKELETALNKEIETGLVVVLPLLYEECDLPPFLKGKLYADFTSPAAFVESLEKLLRRLAFTSS
jgi:hypothetical protein